MSVARMCFAILVHALGCVGAVEQTGCASPASKHSECDGDASAEQRIQARMNDYRRLTDAIAVLTGTRFRPASKQDLANLRHLGLPRIVTEFYAVYEPVECAEGQVRLWPIRHMLKENQELIPGCYVADDGYIVFATTYCGDVYCFNLNDFDEDGAPSIVLISHEMIDHRTTAKDLAQLAKPVAANLLDFLQRFIEERIDEDCGEK